MDKLLEDNTVTNRWIERLALEEINMEKSGVINFNEHLTTETQLEEESIEFVENLRTQFQKHIDRFNELRSQTNGHQQIKVFKISNTINDFMLYRNSLKLVVARKARDVISIGFISGASGPFGARISLGDSAGNKIQEIKAHVGAFNEITWRFQGEEVKVDYLIRHYLTEFIKYSSN